MKEITFELDHTYEFDHSTDILKLSQDDDRSRYTFAKFESDLRAYGPIAQARCEAECDASFDDKVQAAAYRVANADGFSQSTYILTADDIGAA